MTAFHHPAISAQARHESFMNRAPSSYCPADNISNPSKPQFTLPKRIFFFGR